MTNIFRYWANSANGMFPLEGCKNILHVRFSRIFFVHVWVNKSSNI